MDDAEEIDGLRALLADARGIQADAAGFNGRLAALGGTGSSPDGLVTATMAGDGDLVDLRVAEVLIDPDNPQNLIRGVIEAVRAARRDLAAQRAGEIGALTRGLESLAAGLRNQARATREEVKATREQVEPRLPRVPTASQGLGSGFGARPARPQQAAQDPGSGS